MNRPVIGITASVEPASWGVWRDVPAAFVPHRYVRHVHDAGGIAVVVPPLPDDLTEADVRRLLSRLDGLILSGGVDVEPSRYGQQPHPSVQAPRRDRDSSELTLAGVSAAADVPTLGICRGMQVMTVASGGSLEQHLPDRVGDFHAPAPGRYAEHQVAIAAGTRLREILGGSVTVATYHHQGVADHAAFVATAWADDGVLEAFEDPAARFRIGVQWHPEAGTDGRLFDALVAAADSR